MVVKLGGRGPGHKSRSPPGAAAAMTLTGLSTPEASTAGTLIGTLGTVGTTGTPVFALDNSAGSKAALSGANITRGATALSYATASFFDITVSVTGVTPSISPTTFRIAVTTTAVVPALFGMPDASNTGVLAGVTRTTYDGGLTILTPGTVIENKNITGELIIGAPNVTISNCFIHSEDFYGIFATDPSNTNLTIQNCTVEGIGADWANSAILACGTITGNNASKFAIGINVAGGIGPSTITGNYVHGLASSAEAHYDGISLFGPSDGVLIEHNTVDVPAAGGTSDIFLAGSNGPLSNITIRDNLLIGGPSYAVYVLGTNTLIENNYIQRGAFGYFTEGGESPVIQSNILWQQGVDPIPYP